MWRSMLQTLHYEDIRVLLLSISIVALGNAFKDAGNVGVLETHPFRPCSVPGRQLPFLRATLVQAARNHTPSVIHPHLEAGGDILRSDGLQDLAD